MAVASKKYNLDNQLEVQELSVSREQLPVFKPVSFSLNSGQSLQISGANGAGKTTLLRAICGLCNHHSGQVLWQQENIFETPYSFHQNLLYLGHSLGLKPKLTAEQNLNFYRSLRFTKDELLSRSALSQLGIGSYFDEYVSRLSAGQKRRVALARIVTEPVPLWILDEPMVALDTKGQAWLQEACNLHLDKGGMLMITSHQPITGINGLKELMLS